METQGARGRRIIRKKAAQDDPVMRALLDRDLSPEERAAVIVKRAKPAPTNRADPAQTRRLAILDEIIKLAPYLDHPDAQIRSGAKQLWAEKMAAAEKLGAADVRKASTGYALTPELAKTIQSAVSKAFNDLGSRIDALQPRGRS